MSSTNSGIQIRSVQLPAGARHRQVGDEGLSGRHRRSKISSPARSTRSAAADFSPCAARRRSFPNGGPPRIIGNLQQTPDELKALIKTGDWNQIHLLAHGTMHHADSERRGHEHAGRRRCQEPAAQWLDRVPDARRPADEGRVPQHLAQDAVRT